MGYFVPRPKTMYFFKRDCCRVWMLRHVAMGYSVHMQRLFGYLTWWALPRFLPSSYTEFTQEGANLRSDVFSYCE